MKCDELKYERLGDAFNYYPDSTLVIRKQYVDAAIAELKEEIAEFKEAQRWRKFSEEKPQKYTWCLVSGKSLMGNYIVIMDFFEEDDWAENPSLYDDSLDIEWWMPPPSAPKEADK